ncbi:hypothetical protein [Dokdonia sp.]|uniref:hypothetical protein n=1 Tax=Dokdonia sp. TaxID=2024995 RepID=UPI0032668B1B
MRKIFVLVLFTTFSFGCSLESEVVTFRVDGVDYKTDPGEALNVESGKISFSVKRINESAKKRYEDMTVMLDFLDDYNKRYISELDTYLILGSKTYDDKKVHLYHFFKRKNSSRGISLLVMCPYDENEKYKEKIYRVVQSAHF